MLILAFDTAGPVCAVALASSDGGEVHLLAHASERMGRGHAERLMPIIGAVLGDAGLRYADIERIAVTTGPGSFTGVRVGIAAARGLALALAVPAVGIGSLEALARPALRGRSDGALVVALDAKRGEINVLARSVASGGPIFGPEAATGERAAAALAGAERPLVILGDGAHLLAPHLSGTVILAEPQAAPDLAEVALMAMSALTGFPPVPFYARGADAKPQADSVARLAAGCS